MTGESPLFGYAVPLVGVVLVAVGIGAAVTGGYAALERPGEAGETVAAAARMAFEGPSAVAVLISQRLIGAKSFEK